MVARSFIQALGVPFTTSLYTLEEPIVLYVAWCLVRWVFSVMIGVTYRTQQLCVKQTLGEIQPQTFEATLSKVQRWRVSIATATSEMHQCHWRLSFISSF